MTNEQREAFEQASLPLIKYLNEHHHPHTTVIVDCIRAELLEGIISHHTTEFIKD